MSASDDDQQEGLKLLSLAHKEKLLFSPSVTTDSFANSRTVAHQAPLSLGFSRLEDWSGFSFPSPGDLPDPGIEPAPAASPALAGRLSPTEPATGEA